MAREIKIYEEKWHETSTLGTIVGIFTFSDNIAKAVDSGTGAGEKIKYVVEIDGVKYKYDSKSARDEKARKSV